jgi:hypothetical protein
MNHVTVSNRARAPVQLMFGGQNFRTGSRTLLNTLWGLRQLPSTASAATFVGPTRGGAIVELEVGARVRAPPSRSDRVRARVQGSALGQRPSDLIVTFGG